VRHAPAIQKVKVSSLVGLQFYGLRNCCFEEHERYWNKDRMNQTTPWFIKHFTARFELLNKVTIPTFTTGIVGNSTWEIGKELLFYELQFIRKVIRLRHNHCCWSDTFHFRLMLINPLENIPNKIGLKICTVQYIWQLRRNTVILVDQEWVIVFNSNFTALNIDWR